MEQYLIVGQIVNTHGIKGEVKVVPLTDDLNRFKKLKSLFIEMNNLLIEYKIENIKTFNKFVIIKFENVNDMNEAQKLKDIYLKINRSDAVKPKNSFFISDLIDMDVETIEGEYLGKITDVMQPGANDIYVVKNKTSEILIPAIKEVVQSIDIDNKLMKINLIEGLKDL